MGTVINCNLLEYVLANKPHFKQQTAYLGGPDGGLLLLEKTPNILLDRFKV